jgi:hypothetical protein
MTKTRTITTTTFLLAGLVLGCTGDEDGGESTVADPATTDTGTAETTTTSTSTTGEPDDTSSEASSIGPTEEGGEDTGDDGWMPYEACVRGECPEEADECHVYVAHVPVHYCTTFCEDDGDCPPSPGGQAVPICDAYLTYDYCALDCEGKPCPSGMGCFEVTLVDESVVRRCGWVDE